MESKVKSIVVDLEMNPISREEKKKGRRCRQEIIEFGAVLLDENDREINHFQLYVKPQWNQMITPRIRRLTGISSATVSNAPAFEEALSRFLRWCDSIVGEYHIYQWSANDLMQIRKEMEAKGIVPTEAENKFLSDWIDFQEKFLDVVGIKKVFSLREATMIMGVKTVGNEHSALSDARNTAAVIREARDPDLCKGTKEAFEEAMKPKMISATLGELFDFGTLIPEI